MRSTPLSHKGLRRVEVTLGHPARGNPAHRCNHLRTRPLAFLPNQASLLHQMTSFFPSFLRFASKGLLWLLPVPLLPGLAVAACHVVKEGGSGRADGSNWNNALPDLPSSLTRGDVYVLAAGSYGAHHFNDPDDGNKQIEVRAATMASHCSDIGWNSRFLGTAVFRAIQRNAGNVLSFSTDLYLINGAYRSTVTGQPYVDWKSGYGFKVDNANQFACGSDI